jgi:putative membrane protein insertion efficiency factor
MKTLVLGLLGFYKSTLSPAWPSACKFYPSCSAYATEAVSRYGPVRGLILTASRVLRCRPFHSGGIDPVP